MHNLTSEFVLKSVSCRVSVISYQLPGLSTVHSPSRKSLRKFFRIGHSLFTIHYYNDTPRFHTIKSSWPWRTAATVVSPLATFIT